jgi:hypothetical protein
MTSARQEVLAMVGHPDAFAKNYRELLPLQIAAVNELLARQRERIPLLERRAKEAGLTAASNVQQLLPLLFPHTAYKSYPQAFLQKGQWDKMYQWTRTVAAIPEERLDFTGVSNLDQWIERMWSAGNRLAITSGTSGKPSILNANAGDHDRLRFVLQNITGDFEKTIKPDQSRHYFQCLPKKGPYAVNVMAEIYASSFGRPDSIHYISDEPLTAGQITRSIEMRNRVASGAATPTEIAEFEAEAAVRQQEMEKSMDRMVNKMIEVRQEPIWIMGVWPQVWQFVERMRRLGIKPGEFHPGSVLSAGGGRKGANIPEDFEEQIVGFLNKDLYRNRGYGMSEMAGSYKGCEAGRYHQLPSMVTCLMDDAGEQIVEQKGVVTGRFAFIDLNMEGRWGGLITGDRVTIDFSGRCPCGRPGPTLLPDIVRYKDLGDDKIGCAGTIDSYITGSLGA